MSVPAFEKRMEPMGGQHFPCLYISYCLPQKTSLQSIAAPVKTSGQHLGLTYVQAQQTHRGWEGMRKQRHLPLLLIWDGGHWQSLKLWLGHMSLATT